ncbi:MAG: hypothetical protein IPL61_06740 [Myxococcales bacterium]|nr:hypothetical protein [Myxococcales bacterium]
MFDVTPRRLEGLVTFDPGEARDEPWATAMENAIAEFSRPNFEDLFPAGTWLGVKCWSNFCEMMYSVPEAEDEMAFKATLLLVGVGNQTQRSKEGPEGGAIKHRIVYRMSQGEAERRLTASDFLTSQQTFAAEHPERIEAVHRGVAEDRARRP